VGNGITIQNSTSGNITVLSETPFGSTRMEVQPSRDVGFFPIDAGSPMSIQFTVCRLRTIRIKIPQITGFPPRVEYVDHKVEVPTRVPAQGGGDAVPANIPFGRYSIDSEGRLQPC
jgi:hypothetical protein